MKNKLPAKLILEDGSEYSGFSFGGKTSTAGEAVFNTAMMGYPESLTDPSYSGQILILTYPLVGNYGVPNDDREFGLPMYFESDNIHIKALVISDYSYEYSHWNARKSLHEWLEENNVPGIYGIDTRALTKRLREKGAMLGKVIVDEEPDFYDPNKENLVDLVSCKEKTEYGAGENKILLMDCGVKYNIIRSLLKRDTTVIRVPWDYNIKDEEYDGLFISNGPGDPKMCVESIDSLKYALGQDKPVFGICLGNQLLGLAAGADTYKLKYGHRSHNQPVLLHDTQRAFITSQNHGFAIDNDTIPEGWEPLFINLNDGTNEGMKHIDKPFFCTQFHPEASSGPLDTKYLFDDFINMVEKYKR